MSGHEIDIVLSPNAKKSYVVLAEVGDTIGLRVRLGNSIRDQNVRFSFCMEDGFSDQFDVAKDGKIAFPVGIYHHYQTVLIPWYVIEPLGSNTAIQVGTGQTKPHRYTATDDANVANSKFVRDWTDVSGIVEVVFVFPG